jgi:hypothetical protein
LPWDWRTFWNIKYLFLVRNTVPSAVFWMSIEFVSQCHSCRIIRSFHNSTILVFLVFLEWQIYMLHMSHMVMPCAICHYMFHGRPFRIKIQQRVWVPLGEGDSSF